MCVCAQRSCYHVTAPPAGYKEKTELSTRKEWQFRIGEFKEQGREEAQPQTLNPKPKNETGTDTWCVCRESEREGEPSHIHESLIETRQVHFCRKGEARGDGKETWRVDGDTFQRGQRWWTHKNKHQNDTFCDGNKPNCVCSFTFYPCEICFSLFSTPNIDTKIATTTYKKSQCLWVWVCLCVSVTSGQLMLCRHHCGLSLILGCI